MNESSESDRRPGRPRSDESRESILQAATKLLLERGLEGMSIEGIAAQAGASKATVYRWWRTKEVLALDAFAASYGNEFPRARIDMGSLGRDLYASMENRLRSLTIPGMLRAYSALLAQTRADATFAAAFNVRVFAPQRERGRLLFMRAIARGEIDAETDIEVALDLIAGAMVYRLLQGHALVDAVFIKKSVDIVLAGLTRRTGEQSET